MMTHTVILSVSLKHSSSSTLPAGWGSSGIQRFPRNHGFLQFMIDKCVIYVSFSRSLLDGEEVEYDVNSGRDGRTCTSNVTGPNGGRLQV